MSVEIVNARSDPSPNGPPHYTQQLTRYDKNAKREAQQEAFFQEYEKHGTITHSARAAGIDPSYHYKWLETDKTYPERFKEAHRRAVDALEREARRRALEGVEEPTGWYKGEPGGFVKKYSDTLLIFLLKGALPDKYKDRHEHTGKNGGPIEVQSTVTIEQFPIWLKQAIVVISSGIQIDSEVEQVLMSHFEAKFLEAEKLVGKGTTEGQKRVELAESTQSDTIDDGMVVDVVAESVVEAETPAMIQAEPVSVEPIQSRPNWRQAKREKKEKSRERVGKTVLDMDDI